MQKLTRGVVSECVMGRAAAALSGDFVEGASTRTVDKVAIGRPNRRRRNGAVGTCLTALTEEAGLQRPRWPDGRRLFVSSEFFPSQGQDLAAIHRNNGATMNADQILAEIREANLSYLMLAQSLIRTDREQALYRLGISEESASHRLAVAGADDEDRVGQHAAVPLPYGRGRHGLGTAPQPRQERRQRRHRAPARLDPDGRPPSRGGLTCAPRASSPKPSRSAARSR